MKKLLLFDIDATLISMKRSAQKAIMSHASSMAFGYEIPENVIPPLSGKTDRQIISEIMENLQISASNHNTITEKFLHGLREITPQYSTSSTIDILVGVRELIQYFHKSDDYTIALLTGNNKECAYFKLAPVGLDNFFRFGAFGCDHHDRGKLPPIAIKRANSAMNITNFSENTTLIIGDSPGDVYCAKVNKIPVLAVATGRYSKQELSDLGADSVITNFSDLDESVSSIKNLLRF